MSDDNMKLWNAVHEVPDQYRKPFKIGSRQLTSIDPMYLISLATAQWGPIGTGWGFEIVEEGIVNGNNRERPEDALHTMRIKLWYGGPIGPTTVLAIGTIGVGCTKLYMGKGDKAWIDDDYNKKTLTDAITNALSRLGFGADVRMGEFDGSKYNENVNGQDSELEKAWTDFLIWRRQDPELQDLSDATLINGGTTMLEANSRRVTPETIRDMMK